MAYYTWIEKETCIACGVCGVTAPTLFDYDEEGIAYGIRDDNSGQKEVPVADEEDLLDAKDGCPTESVQVYHKE